MSVVSWGEHAYAGFWRRFVGILIDGIILSLVLSLLAALFAPAGLPDAIDPVTLQVRPGYFAAVAGWSGVGVVVWVAYETAMLATLGWTLGKKVVGVEVRGADGALLSVPRALGRSLGKYVSALPLYLGFLWAAWDRRKQAWHDKFVSSYALKRAVLQPAGEHAAPAEGPPTRAEPQAQSPWGIPGQQSRAAPAGTAEAAPGAPPDAAGAPDAGAPPEARRPDEAPAAARAPGAAPPDEAPAAARPEAPPPREPSILDDFSFEEPSERPPEAPERPHAGGPETPAAGAPGEPAVREEPAARLEAREEPAARPEAREEPTTRPEAVSEEPTTRPEAVSEEPTARPEPAAAEEPAVREETASPQEPPAGEREETGPAEPAQQAPTREEGVAPQQPATGPAAPTGPPRTAPPPPAQDPNVVGIARAGVAAESAGWLQQVAAQVDARLDLVSRSWRSNPQAEAARACAFGLLLGYLARIYPHMQGDLSRVAEAHPSFSTLTAGSRLQTLQEIAGDPGRATAWIGPLVGVNDPNRVCHLFE